MSELDPMRWADALVKVITLYPEASVVLIVLAVVVFLRFGLAPVIRAFKGK